jgi:hypothetical protein
MRKLNTNIKRWQLGVASLAVLIAGGLAVTSAVRSAGSPPPISFAAVAPEVLEAAGINLTEPQNPSAPAGSAASGKTAAAAASKAFGGAAVRESHFAHCNVANAAPPIDEDCWAISLDPSGFHSHGPATTTIAATYLIVLIDPATGQALLGESGAP